MDQAGGYFAWNVVSLNLSIWIAPLLALTLAAVLLLLMLRNADRLPLDHPNARSLHSRRTPRIGGLALIPALLVAVLVTTRDSTVLCLMAAVTGLFLLSALDDRRGLPVTLRFGGHILAAAGATVLFDLGFAGGIVVLLSIAWMTNLYNFMDGANGLAGGMAVCGFATYAIATRDVNLAILASAVAGAALGFLLFNFDPARVFLGDAGAIPLGFLAGVLGIWGFVRDDWPIWFPLLVFAPFVLDASVTLLRRVFRREPFWQAHREHYYQRMVRMGWTHRRLAGFEYLLMFLTDAWALTLLFLPNQFQWAGVAGSCAIYAALMNAIDRRWSRWAV